MKFAGLISNGIAIAAAILFYLSLSGSRLPIISNNKAAFFILWIIGLSMSAVGGMRDGDIMFNMPKPIMWILMALGIIAFILLVFMLFSIRKPLLFDYKTAIIILAVIISAKLIITRGYLVYKMLS
ncbi:MAG: hypothetical protein ACOZCL_11890 [Bacillota bacterium]